MFKFGKVYGATLLTLVLLTLCSRAAAQELNEGSREAVGYIGGLERNGGAFTLGAGYGYALRRRWLVIGELGFVSGGGAHGVEFGANAHYLFPLRDYPKVTPYGLVGLGILHFGCDGCGSATTGGINFGGGARWQTGTNWGIRPEIKFLAGNHFYTRFSAGVYYEFGK